MSCISQTGGKEIFFVFEFEQDCGGHRHRNVFCRIAREGEQRARFLHRCDDPML
jgi:hypothetical protein